MTGIGKSIKNYLIESRLCEGGMGTLYLGFDKKLQREVVLKGIRVDQQETIAKKRFLREAHALSNLDHPNICRIYDYVEGEQEDYLVLERIKGITLDEEIKEGCDSRKKLQIAIQIAEALTLAHKTGFVHRDLKLSNVMVTPEGQVKVLDFGLAFRTDDLPLKPSNFGSDKQPAGFDEPCGFLDLIGQDTPTPDYTVQGSIVGTLNAMSPEQARGDRATTASDMYSFGLLLQRLFTEQPCYDSDMTTPALLEMVAEGETVAPTGKLDPQIASLIQGLKSMDPGARPTAQEALAQLQLILQKPMRRLRYALMAAAAVIIILAVAKYVIDLDRAQKRSELARLEAEEVTSFMLEVFKISDPGEARGETITARELLRISAERLETKKELQPAIKTRMLLTIGEVYKNLGLLESAKGMYQQALDISRDQKPENPIIIAECLHGLGTAYNQMGKYEQAQTYLKEGLARVEKTFGKDHLEVARFYSELGASFWDKGQRQESEAYFQKSFQLRELYLPPDHPDLAISLSHLGLINRHNGQYAQAESLYKRSIRILEKNEGSEHPDLAVPLINLGVVFRNQGRIKEAGGVYRRVLRIQEKVLGKENPKVAVVLNNLAIIHWRLGNYSEASTFGKRSLEIRKKFFGLDHVKTAYPMNALGQIRWKQGRLQEAETLLSQALSIWESNLRPDHNLLAWPLSGLAGVRRDQGRYLEAENLFRKAMAIRSESLNEDHPDLIHTRNEYAQLLRKLGREDKASQLDPATAKMPLK